MPKYFSIATFFLFFSLLFSAAGQAAYLTLPAWRCDGDTLMRAGFDDGESAYSPNPSNGQGGAFNDTLYTIATSEGPAQYFVYASPFYGIDTSRPAPLLVALHGFVPDALAAAQDIVLNWAYAAQPAGAVVIAPAAVSPLLGGFTWSLQSDKVRIAAVIADAKQRYNIDQNRVYAWGFSAGGSVLHKWLLETNNFATAYTVHAGRLNATQSTSLPASSPAKVPLLLYASPADTSIYPEMLLDKQRFLSAGWSEGSNLQFSEYPHGHFYVAQDTEIAWQFVCRFAATP